MTAGAAEKELWLCRGGRQDSDRYCQRTDQQRVPNNACRKKCVAADGERKAQGLHQAQGLQNVVPDGNIGNFAEWAYFMIEDKVP